jgi:4-amino-4-deoxy-L-arabinose transferase-like glycosyltransferase
MTFADSLSIRIFGAPDLLPVRAVSLVFGLVLLAAVYSIGYRLGGRRLGWSSVFLVALSWPFLYSSHLARYDVMAAAFGFLAIAFYFSSRQDFWIGLLSGLCVGLAFETHAYSMIYAPAILALYFWEYRWAMFRQLRFWGFLIGGSIGLFFYAALHVLPYPQTYLTVNQLAFGSTRTPPLLTFAPRVILQSLGDIAWMLFAVYQPMLVVISWGIMALLRRHSRAGQTLLVLSAVLVLAHALAVRTKFLYYAILVTPALDIVAATFLLEFVRRPWRGRLWDYVSRVVVWGMAIGGVVLTWSVLRIDFGQAYRMVQSRINQVVQPGDSIMSSQVYWFGLQDHTYYSWELLPAYQLYLPGSKLEDALQEFHPDIFIIDK